MKVSPIAAGTATINPNEGQTASPDKLAKAKAIALGQTPEVAQPVKADPQIERAQSSIKKIKMKTQMSQNRHLKLEEPAVEAASATVETAPSDKAALIEQTVVASEETKPLSPQVVALAKEKRAFQLEKQAFLAEKQALESQTSGTKSLEEYRARIKANALSVLQEEGVTYDQLTEQILASNQDSEAIAALKAEMKALKEGVDKTLTEREASAEAQVFKQIEGEAKQLIADGDFEAIREAGYLPEVMRLIETDWKKNGYVWDVAEACKEVENILIERSLKWAKLKKVQSRLTPAQPEKQQLVQQDKPNTKIMRTLTNRDGSSSLTMSKRERAIAAMEGRLKS